MNAVPYDVILYHTVVQYRTVPSPTLASLFDYSTVLSSKSQDALALLYSHNFKSSRIIDDTMLRPPGHNAFRSKMHSHYFKLLDRFAIVQQGFEYLCEHVSQSVRARGVVALLLPCSSPLSPMLLHFVPLLLPSTLPGQGRVYHGVSPAQCGVPGCAAEPGGGAQERKPVRVEAPAWRSCDCSARSAAQHGVCRCSVADGHARSLRRMNFGGGLSTKVIGALRPDA